MDWRERCASQSLTGGPTDLPQLTAHRYLFYDAALATTSDVQAVVA